MSYQVLDSVFASIFEAGDDFLAEGSRMLFSENLALGGKVFQLIERFTDGDPTRGQDFMAVTTFMYRALRSQAEADRLRKRFDS